MAVGVAQRAAAAASEGVAVLVAAVTVTAAEVEAVPAAGAAAVGHSGSQCSTEPLGLSSRRYARFVVCAPRTWTSQSGLGCEPGEQAWGSGKAATADLYLNTPFCR